MIQENPAWDDPISEKQRLRWTTNFKMIEDIRDIHYSRCVVPENATSLKADFWILCDAAEIGVMVGCYASFPLPDNKRSCSNVLGKGLLAPDEWTIPRKELSALETAVCVSCVKTALERAL